MFLVQLSARSLLAESLQDDRSTEAAPPRTTVHHKPLLQYHRHKLDRRRWNGGVQIRPGRLLEHDFMHVLLGEKCRILSRVSRYVCLRSNRSSSRSCLRHR